MPRRPDPKAIGCFSCWAPDPSPFDERSAEAKLNAVTAVLDLQSGWMTTYHEDGIDVQQFESPLSGTPLLKSTLRCKTSARQAWRMVSDGKQACRWDSTDRGYAYLTGDAHAVNAHSRLMHYKTQFPGCFRPRDGLVHECQDAERMITTQISTTHVEYPALRGVIRMNQRVWAVRVLPDTSDGARCVVEVLLQIELGGAFDDSWARGPLIELGHCLASMLRAQQLKAWPDVCKKFRRVIETGPLES